ncbi:uncharacterized protein LOC115634696 [Scaptodrosophila lebanonensis]|uniref:Uncharacterized protein LOC115634696 n=1 Tax=Drosophila lebanonensis TaxID=7225 RepID=A0A6J2UJM8_DROLE|nr:uncharacterized protein LOC115634696 [Scaptodrosophila lebanonensis]
MTSPKTTEADLNKANAPEVCKAYDFEDRFEEYLRRIFYLKSAEEIKRTNSSVVEYFGVLSLTDFRRPERKLWYLFYCPQSRIVETLDQLQTKYGKKNICEIFRKPVFSGVGMRAVVKKHFSEMKWYTNGNLIEAPPKSYYDDKRMLKTLTDLYNLERKKLYNYISMKHNHFKRYN